MLFDILITYVICGVTSIIFLSINDLFFLNTTSGNIEVENPKKLSYLVAVSLINCINIGIILTSVVVWPLVLATCILQRNSIDDEL